MLLRRATRALGRRSFGFPCGFETTRGFLLLWGFDTMPAGALLPAACRPLARFMLNAVVIRGMGHVPVNNARPQAKENVNMVVP